MGGTPSAPESTAGDGAGDDLGFVAEDDLSGTPKLHMARRLTERTTTVALANDLEALRATKPRTLEAWLELADTEDRDAVLEAIRDRTLLPNALSLVLRRNGIPVSRETIIQMREDKQ